MNSQKSLYGNIGQTGKNHQTLKEFMKADWILKKLTMFFLQKSEIFILFKHLSMKISPLRCNISFSIRVLGLERLQDEKQQVRVKKKKTSQQTMQFSSQICQRDYFLEEIRRLLLSVGKSKTVRRRIRADQH